jgi:folate-binding protein YgfZ
VRQGAGWTRLSRLALIRVTGPQRVKFLHGLLSNDIAGLATGQSRLCALMNIRGQQVAWMKVMAEADALVCEVPAGTRDVVVETFIHYKVGAPVRFEKPDTEVFGVFGGKGAEAISAVGFTTTPKEPETFNTESFGADVLRVSRGRDLPAAGFTLHAPHAAATAVEEKLRSVIGEAMPADVLETLRVEEGIPWHGIDVGEENLLHETGQLNVYHSPSKGCYLGQEVVARLEGRGANVNKRFVGLKCSQPVAAGNEVTSDGKPLGRVTSAGVSPEFGPIAMGYVHRSHADAGCVVEMGRARAEIVALPFRA